MSYLDKYPMAQTIAHVLLEQRAAENADAIFYSFCDEVWTLGRFNATANRMARNLAAQGIGAGSHVAILMDTSPDYLALWFALSKLGAVEIPINTAYRGALLTHVLRTANASHAVIDARFADVLAEAAPAPLEQIVIRGEISGTQLPGPVLPFDALHGPAAEDDLGLPVRHDTLAGVIFTSGTTGPSKGVMLSHHYLTAYGLMYADINELKDDDVILNFLPFFHIAAKFKTIATLACGGRMRLQERLSISTFWDEVRAHGVTNFVGVGGICNMLIARPPSPDDASTPIRTIYAVPDPADIHTELERRFGCRITTVYGSTEAGLPLYRAASDPYKPMACGRVSPHYEVQIVDEDDLPVPVGETGNILVRPKRPHLIGSGYISMPDQTVEAWRNLWLHTGDRGHCDDEGWFFFDDRASDSLRRRGENISSFEVETLVARHPGVAEAIVVGAPSDVGEDEVRVLVIPREGARLTHEDILRHCADVMPYFMVPRYIDIVPTVPRTATAKVEKYRIRATGLTGETWDCVAHGWRMTRDGLVAPE